MIEFAHEISKVPRRKIHDELSDHTHKDSYANSNSYGNTNKHFKIPSNNEMVLLYTYAIAIADDTNNADECKNIINLMVNIGLNPSEEIVNRVMMCLTRNKKYDDVLALFVQLPSLGIERDKRHATLFVESLARLGRVSDALKALNSMKAQGQALMLPAYRSTLSIILFYLSKKEFIEIKAKSSIRKQDAIKAAVDILNHITKKAVVTNEEMENKASSLLSSSAISSGLKKEIKKFLRKAPLDVREDLLACVNDNGTPKTIKLMKLISSSLDANASKDISKNDT